MVAGAVTVAVEEEEEEEAEEVVAAEEVAPVWPDARVDSSTRPNTWATCSRSCCQAALSRAVAAAVCTRPPPRSPRCSPCSTSGCSHARDADDAEIGS